MKKSVKSMKTKGLELRVGEQVCQVNENTGFGVENMYGNSMKTTGL